jgi:hypothetical protein
MVPNGFEGTFAADAEGFTQIPDGTRQAGDGPNQAGTRERHPPGSAPDVAQIRCPRLARTING